MALVLYISLYWGVVAFFMLAVSSQLESYNFNKAQATSFSRALVKEAFLSYAADNGSFPVSATPTTATDLQWLAANNSQYTHLRALTPLSKGGFLNTETDAVLTLSTPTPNNASTTLKDAYYSVQKTLIATGDSAKFGTSNFNYFTSSANSALTVPSAYTGSLLFSPKSNSYLINYDDLNTSAVSRAHQAGITKALASTANNFKTYYKGLTTLPPGVAGGHNFYQNVTAIGTSSTVGTSLNTCRGLFAYPSGQLVQNVILSCGDMWVGSNPVRYVRNSSNSLTLSVATPLYDLNKSAITVSVTKTFP